MKLVTSFCSNLTKNDKNSNYFLNSQTSKQTWNFESINVKMEQKTSENHSFNFSVILWRVCTENTFFEGFRGSLLKTKLPEKFFGTQSFFSKKNFLAPATFGAPTETRTKRTVPPKNAENGLQRCCWKTLLCLRNKTFF